jgi:acyl-CoA thioesterase FadM
VARVEIVFEGPVLFRHELDVRVSDLNYGNHLGHDALVGLLHEARVRFLGRCGLHELDVAGASMVMASLAVRYRAEAHLGERLSVEVAAGDVSSRLVELRYRVRSLDRDRIVADASTVMACLDPATGRVITVPAVLRDALTGRAEV